MVTVLQQIIAGVKEDVAAREAIVPFKEIKARSKDCEPPRDVLGALLSPGCGVIAEVKRAEPGREIAEIHCPTGLAEDFEAGGASLIACHTERRRFKGTLEEMAEIRAHVSVPIMCRDFIVDPYQIHEARCYGADMVPLRVAALEQSHLVALLDRVQTLGMVALVEVGTPEEATRALEAGARVVGINARDFNTMTLNRAAFSEISPGLPSETIRVALSGVSTAKELLSYASCGADAVVIGTSLVQSASPRLFTRALVAAGQHPSCPRRSE